MTKAVAYLRTSGITDDGFPRQIAACEAYAKRNDLQIVRDYRDEHVSGKNELDDRPGLQRLIADLLANGVRTVLVEKLDRVARDLMVQEAIIQDLTRKGIVIISTCEPEICSTDPTRVLIRQILGAFFEYERKMIISKLVSARQRKRARGERCEGKLPFGAHEGEAATLHDMIAARSAGQSYDEIAKGLNARGIRTRHDRKWHATTVQKIISRASVPSRT